jgi:hypothetical protein
MAIWAAQPSPSTKRPRLMWPDGLRARAGWHYGLRSRPNTSPKAIFRAGPTRWPDDDMMGHLGRASSQHDSKMVAADRPARWRWSAADRRAEEVVDGGSPRAEVVAGGYPRSWAVAEARKRVAGGEGRGLCTGGQRGRRNRRVA